MNGSPRAAVCRTVGVRNTVSPTDDLPTGFSDKWHDGAMAGAGVRFGCKINVRFTDNPTVCTGCIVTGPAR